MSKPPEKRAGASRGVLENIVPDASVSEDESLAGMVSRFDQEEGWPLIREKSDNLL